MLRYVTTNKEKIHKQWCSNKNTSTEQYGMLCSNQKVTTITKQRLYTWLQKNQTPKKTNKKTVKQIQSMYVRSLKSKNKQRW